MLEYTEKSSLDVINFTNIDGEDYEGMWGGEITIIKAGEVKPFPRFLAYHYAKHLIDKILLRSGKDSGDDLLRQPLEQKILGGIATHLEETPKEEVADLSVNVEEFAGKPIEEVQTIEPVEEVEEPVKHKRAKK